MTSFRIPQSFLNITLDDLAAYIISAFPDQTTEQFTHNYNQLMYMSRIVAILLIFTTLHQTVKTQLQEIDIIKFWNSNSSIHSNLQISRTLFVTSWNSQGRKYAIQYAYKFQSVILCLYDLRFQDRQFFIEKLVQIQPHFLKQLRRVNPNIKLILRIYVSSSSKSIFEYVSSSTKKISDLALAIVKIMRKQKASGIFYDSLYNLPIKMNSAQNYGPYDKFAILLNTYILNRIREQFNQKQKLIYGIKLEQWKIQDIDFGSLKQLKSHAIMIESLDNRHADVLMTRALSFIKQMRKIDSHIELYLTLPLFSWRNGVGIKTPTVKSILIKNGIGFRGFRHGLCYYVQKNGGAENSVPCDHYYQVAKQYAHDFNFKLAFFQAGDAMQKQFDII